jgi:hypothetical protein
MCEKCGEIERVRQRKKEAPGSRPPMTA